MFVQGGLSRYLSLSLTKSWDYLRSYSGGLLSSQSGHHIALHCWPQILWQKSGTLGQCRTLNTIDHSKLEQNSKCCFMPLKIFWFYKTKGFIMSFPQTCANYTFRPIPMLFLIHFPGYLCPHSYQFCFYCRVFSSLLDST